MSAQTATPASFDYDRVPKPGQARAAAERIRKRLARTAENIVAIGKDLAAQKKALGHGHFLQWIAAEFDMSQSTALNFMRVAKRFGSNPQALKDLSPTALTLLAAPSTPRAVTDEVLTRAEAGEAPSTREIQRLKETVKAATDEETVPREVQEQPPSRPRRTSSEVAAWKLEIAFHRAVENVAGSCQWLDEIVTLPPLQSDHALDIAKKIKKARRMLGGLEGRLEQMGRGE